MATRTTPWSKALVFLAFPAVVAASLACSPTDSCESAGGKCVGGGSVCAVMGSPSCGGSPAPPGGFFCCLDQTADCGQPATTTFSCAGAVPDAAPCLGGPLLPQATSAAPTTDASFAVGCSATLPVCNNGQPITCTCGGSGAASGWECAYE